MFFDLTETNNAYRSAKVRMIPFVVVLLLLVLTSVEAMAACTGSSPRWTSTPDQASVSSCLNSASRGDTINVTAGDGLETYSTNLTITKGVKLLGPGRDNLTLTRGGVLLQISPDATAISKEEIIKITGFTFDGNNSATTIVSITGPGATASKPFKNLVFGDNRLKNTGTSSSAEAIHQNGQVRGVLYSNIFDRVNIVLRPFGSDDIQEWANSAYNNFAYGSADNLFFEDNTITYSSSFSGVNPGWIESGQGGRLAARYNSWNMANANSPSEFWDIHGFQNFNGTNSGQTGTMITEYYGNTGSNIGFSRWVNHRGSWGLFFNNIMAGSPGGMQINQYASGDAGGSGCTAQVPGAAGKYVPEVNNTYAFNNTHDGSTTNMGQGPIGDGCGTAQNSPTLGWFNYNASCTATECSAGIGRGTTPPTGTCAVGTGYWVSSTPTPTSNSEVIQASVFYKCTSVNTWTAYYRPYPYPHPLRSASNPPAPPSGLIVR